MYGILLWGHSPVLGRIFGIQRRVVRVLSGLGYQDDCRISFSELNIMTVPSLYIYECLKYIRSEVTSVVMILMYILIELVQQRMSLAQ